MKTYKEIKQEANLIYTRSSHYITGTFIVVCTITGIATAILQLIGTEIHMPAIILLSCLFSPFEYGMVHACLRSYVRKAREITTNQTPWLGLKYYGAIFLPYAGKTLILTVSQGLLLALFVFIGGRYWDEFWLCFGTVLTGNVDYLMQDGQFTVTVSSLLGIVTAIIAGFVMEGYFAFAYYLVNEENQGLLESLTTSYQMMNGHFMTYLKIRLSYLPHAILTMVVVNIFSISLTTMFQQLAALLPGIPLFVFNILLSAIVAAISAFAGVMFYREKQMLAITVLYEDIKKEA